MALPPNISQAAIDALAVVNDFLVANQDWKVTPQPNGQLQWGNPVAPPPPPTPVIGVISIPQQIQSTPYSIDLSQFLSGGPYTALTLLGTLPSGWSFASPVLSYSGTGVGGVNMALQASWTGGTPVTSNSFVVQSVALVGPDIYPPTIPFNPLATLVSNQPNLSFLASSDPAPQGVTWSGMKDYRVWRTVNGGPLQLMLPGGLTKPAASVTPADFTFAAPSKGLQFAMSAADIGSPAVAGSTTQVGSTISISGGGIDFSGTGDQGQFCGAPINGNWSVSWIVTALSGPQAFSSAGVNARLSLAASAPATTAKVTPSGEILDFRGSSGGPTTDVFTNIVTPTFPLYCELDYNNGQFVYSTGEAPSGLTSVSPALANALGAAVTLGAYATAHQATGTTSATLSQFNVTQEGRLSYIDTSLTPGPAAQTAVYYFTARDNALNECAASATVSVTIAATGGSTVGIKNTNGVITDLNGVKKPLYLVCVSGLETMHGGGARVAGIANASQAQWAQALTSWGPSKGRNAMAQPTGLRFQTISSYWNGDTGVDGPLVDSSGWYSGGKPVMSASAYQAAVIQAITRATAAGWPCFVSLCIDSITEPNGTVHLGLGQPCAPGPTAVKFWGSVANAFKNNLMVGFELFNESIMSNIFGTSGGFGWYGGGGNAANNQPYGGPTSPGPDAITYRDAVSTSTIYTPPGGCTMMNNSANSSTLVNICPSMKLAGIKEMIATIAATGAQNLIAVGVPGFAGGIDDWLGLGLTDPRGNKQIAAAYHAYGQGHVQSMRALQAAGVPMIMTEADGGDFAASGFTFKEINAAGLAASAGSNGWNNWGAGSNIMTGGASPLTTPPENQGMPVPNGSN